MKRIFLMIMFVLSLQFLANAQDKDKVKKTSTIPQKIHNTFSKHKRYKGYKIKHKHNGITRKHKVNLKEGKVKNKIK